MSIGHSSKINPLNDFAPGTSRVQMGGECVGVSFRIAIKKPLCIDDDATDTYCWQNKCLVATFVIPSNRDESELRHPCYSQGPHLRNGWPLLGRKLMAGNHFLYAMLSAPCRHCCQRDDETLTNYCSSQAAPNVLSYWGEIEKEKEAAAGRCWCLPLFDWSPAAGSCFCGCDDHVGSTTHELRTAAYNPAEAAGRWNTNTLCHKIFKESCAFSFLLISSPGLYFSSFAEGPEVNQKYPQSPFKYFAVFT